MKLSSQVHSLQFSWNFFLSCPNCIHVLSKGWSFPFIWSIKRITFPRYPLCVYFSVHLPWVALPFVYNKSQPLVWLILQKSFIIKSQPTFATICFTKLLIQTSNSSQICSSHVICSMLLSTVVCSFTHSIPSKNLFPP